MENEEIQEEVVEESTVDDAVDELSAALGDDEPEYEELADSEPDDSEEDTDADESKEEAAEEPAEEKPADEPSSEPTDEPQVDDSLLERAVKAGIPMKLAKSTKPDALEEYVASLESKNQEVEVSPDKTDDAPEPFKHGLDPEVYDESFIKPFDEITKVVNSLQETVASLKAENESLKGKVEVTYAQAEAEASSRALKMFDDDVASLGDDFKDVVGEGGYGAELQKSNPKAFQARQSILSNLASLRKAMPDESTAELFKMAVYKATGKMPGVKAEPEVDGTPEKLAKHAGRVVGKPNSSTKQNTTTGELNAAIRQLDEALG